ncbi:BspA family leucine-rich repeat surface protein [Mycoplasma capricolum]|uniref:BspA family leucine-rich repeat surface protein n=1 Tax=Mycoplasma capricolum TaxID=2095 RepID=UPI0022F3A221|nr:BspA family leucine-rich repeat surface protein [Mycoplasma capricolum]WBX36422.1 BspA family leucine-rich repeat surface protein [Mycoplasma capricolum subsp. capricolum]
MKKLLTILASSSVIFLITVSISMLNNINKNYLVSYNAISWIKRHKTSGNMLIDIGYYKSGNSYIIQQIPPTISIIAAELPEQITSLRNAFYGNRQHIRFEKQWDTKNITDMSGTFYDANWMNDDSVKKWNTSKVTDMSKMFKRAKSFNQDISNWDVSSVRNFEGMFDDAIEFNNGNNPLNWSEKLKNVTNMKSMFKNAYEFKHNLNNWIMTRKVDHSNFGLEDRKQPKWFVEPLVERTSSASAAQSDNSNISSLNSNSNRNSQDITSGSITEKTQNKPEIIVEKPLEPPKLSERSEKLPNKSELNNLENETMIEEKSLTSKNRSIESNVHKKNAYKIPLARANTLVSKSNSANAGVIAGAVLGSFTILITTAGLGYYYRKNLKNLYLKSADKIKPSLLKSKDNIKDFYFKSIDKTKNLYLKSKNKIKDKIEKIKSKK